MTIRYTSVECAALLEELRLRQPLVQCITNEVVTNFTANVLLAIGAAPAMVAIPGEASEFPAVASGVLINLGTPNTEQRTAMFEAATAATAASTPWVLDPVAIGSLSVRTDTAGSLVRLRPTIIRGNASEVIALAGAGVGGRGVDSTDSSFAALGAARQLATAHGSAVAVSGETDVIVGPGDAGTVTVGNGHPLLTKVTGGGCALGAVMAAFSSLTADAVLAATAATGVYTVAAERAAAFSRGPGSFAAAFLDTLSSISADDVAAVLRLGVLDASAQAGGGSR